jgi:NitT/TauT family transport system ATP-binding protein
LPILGLLGVKSNHTTLFITHSIDEALILSDRVVIMSTTSVRVKAVFENDLQRPHQMELQFAGCYLELKRKAWSLVEEEVLSSLGIRKG